MNAETIKVGNRRLALWGTVLVVIGIAASPIATSSIGAMSSSDALATAFAIAGTIHDIAVPFGATLVAAAMALRVLVHASSACDEN